MKRILAALVISFAAATSAQAMSYRQNLPSLICQDELLRIPERGFQVEVFAKSSLRPDVTVRVQAVDTNLGNETLYSGAVVEKIEDYSSQFVGENLVLSLVSENSGEIRGEVVFSQNNDTYRIPVSCQKYYHIMQPLVAK